MVVVFGRKVRNTPENFENKKICLVTVNHSKNFVDPETLIPTLNVMVGKPGRNTEVWAVPKHFLGYLAEYILNSHCRSRKHDPTKDVSASGNTRNSEIDEFKDIRTLNETVDYLVEDNDITTLFLL